MGSISISNLGKAYKQYPTRWTRLAEWLLPGKKPRHQLKWVLQNISFTVNPGEAIGIIGINGAGKSTLLKMITGTTQPTTGSVHMTGRVAALLELGMGFHPDFTGRQNVFMAGQLLGYTVEDIARLMPDIEAFAEIGDYIDQPVRVYSSGMQMRLAFSVATAHRPDILIVDEALSVGDAYFQHKSFGRIREYREQGTTLLIVSHDRVAIQGLCDRAILLENGTVIKDSNPEEVFDFYNAIIAEKENNTLEVTQLDNGRAKTTSGTGEVKFNQISLYNSKGELAEIVGVGELVELRLVAQVNEDVKSLVLGCGIKDRLGQMMFGTNTFHTKQIIHCPKNGDVYVFKVSFLANLGVGSYSVHASLVEEQSHIEKNFQWIDRALMFNVVNMDKHEFVGSQWNEMNFVIEKK